jgi:Arc/MetJ-type ribon-helix-helix transcriptional regulator
MTTKRNPPRDDGEKLRELREAIQEGLDSGTSERTMADIWAEAERRFYLRKAKARRS